MKRLRGLKNLVGDAVEHGSRAVEKVQKDTARVPFSLLEKIGPIAVPVRGMREIYETSIAGVHGMIRLVNRVAGDTFDTVLDVVDKRAPAAAEAVEKAVGAAEKAVGIADTGAAAEAVAAPPKAKKERAAG